MTAPYFRPNTDDEAVWHAVYASDEYRVPAFAPTDVVLDLGLATGAFTARAHDRGSRQIYAFEVCPENFAIAKRNVGSLVGVHLYHQAVVGDRQPSTLPFPVGNNSFFIADHATVEVPTITLHEIVSKLGEVRYLKIDIEGSEWEVLYSLPREMFAQIHEIVGEYHQPSQTYWGLVQNRRHPDYDHLTLQRYLQEAGYCTSFRAPTPPPMSGAFRAVRA
jgi:FkbM family methyltransferase